MTYGINTRMQAVTPAAGWRKSSFCSNTSTCVEVAVLPDGVTAMRDGKDADGPQLSFEPTPWAQFVEAVRAGEFNPEP